MVLFVAGSIYFPQLSAPDPTQNFIYMTGDYYYPDIQYFVENGKLARRAQISPQPNYYPKQEIINPKFYFHDVEKNQSREITFDEAAAYNLETSNLSQEGFEVVHGSGGGGFLFFEGPYDYNAYFLKGHGTSQKLNLRLSSQQYDLNFKFLGWVK